jgi:hypothetical protein
MIFSPWSRVVCGWCMSDPGVPRNNKVEIGRFPRASHSPLLCTRGVDSVAVVHRRVLWLETQ